MKISNLLVILGLSATVGSAALAAEVKGNAATGATKVAVCQACHGVAGKVPAAPIYPSLAGQSTEYLQSAMISYRDGLRQGGMSAMMSPQVATLSDQEIGDIAAYYSQQTPSRAVPAALAAAEPAAAAADPAPAAAEDKAKSAPAKP